MRVTNKLKNVAGDLPISDDTELAVNAAKGSEKSRIILQYIQLAIRNDEGLNNNKSILKSCLSEMKPLQEFK